MFFMKFRFHSIAPKIGIELNGLFFPNINPFPDFFFVFFFVLPRPTVVSQLPINGGGFE